MLLLQASYFVEFCCLEYIVLWYVQLLKILKYHSCLFRCTVYYVYYLQNVWIPPHKYVFWVWWQGVAWRKRKWLASNVPADCTRNVLGFFWILLLAKTNNSIFIIAFEYCSNREQCEKRSLCKLCGLKNKACLPFFIINPWPLENPKAAVLMRWTVFIREPCFC